LTFFKEKLVFDKSHNYEQIARNKPHGFWYSLSDSWIKYISQDKRWLRSIERKLVYEVKLKENIFTKIDKPDEGKILVLDSKRDILQFNDRYIDDRIDWENAAKEFGGIELRNYDYELESTFSVNPRMDVSGGCVWDLNIIEEVNCVGEVKELWHI
jgi:hypothetical protein